MKADDGRFAPKPVRSDTQRGRLLTVLEVPACRCPQGTHDDPLPPCRHIRELAKKFPDITLDEFLALLREEDSDQHTRRSPSYDTPPLPAAVAVPLTPQCALTLYDERAGNGQALHAPGDGQIDDHDEIGYRAENSEQCEDAREHDAVALPVLVNDLWYADAATAEDVHLATHDERSVLGERSPVGEIAARDLPAEQKAAARAELVALTKLAAARHGRRLLRMAAARREIEAAFQVTKVRGK